ncbi:MAG: phospholipase A [Pseudomonadales bacterium]|jgi:phospholipase A1|nr:phospholipase A [Pseudomonadales bacterium]
MTANPFDRTTLALALLLVVGVTEAAPMSFEDCVMQAVTESEGSRTVASIRTACESTAGTRSTERAAAPAPETRVQARFRAEYDVASSDFAISTYQPNYLMYTNNTRFNASESIYASVDSDFNDLKQEEMKFQVSFKLPVWRDMLGSDVDMYAGYTQTSWWQLFSDEGITSAPFRETNYEPEIFVRKALDVDLPFDGKLAAADLAIVHQSNGRSELLSRSWNRLMARSAFDYGDLAFLVRAWYRLPEDDEDDDNPNTEDFYGYGDIRAVWAPNRNTFSAMFRPGEEESGMELTWSRPITQELRIYAQWWYGYGESLIDYDEKVNRFGIGVAANDFLMNR